MTGIEFDGPSHTYKVGGVVVPGVTSVLRDLSIMKRLDPVMLVQAADRGRRVHKTIELYCKDDLNEGQLPSELVPYLRAWKRFVDDRDFEFIYGEQIVFSERWGYAGTFDLFGTWKSTGKRRPMILLDVKSGAADPVHGPQTAAYLEATLEMDLLGIPRRHTPQRAALRLQPNGYYQVDDYMDPMDWSTFLAALTVHKFKDRHGTL